MTGSALLLGQDGANLGIFRVLWLIWLASCKIAYWIFVKKGFVSAALKSAGVTESSVSVIEQNERTGGFMNGLELLNITILQVTRKVRG